MLPVFNEEDIIEEVIEHLISQGLKLVVLDNGSTDKSFQICEKFLDKGIIKLEQFKSSTFQWSLLGRKLYDMAIFESPEWVLRSDADQYLESGIKNLTLKDAISQADAEGYNIIQFNRFDFFITDNDNESLKSIKEKLTYYSYQNDYGYRAWKFVSGIDVEGLGSHCPIFPEGEVYKIYPEKMVMRHYTYRNKQQKEKKIQERVKRMSGISSERKIARFIEKNSENNYPSCVDHRILTKYNEDDKWNLEPKFTPFVAKRPSRNEMFSDDGFLNFEYSPKGKERKLEELLAKKQAKLEELLAKKQAQV